MATKSQFATDILVSRNNNFLFDFHGFYLKMSKSLSGCGYKVCVTFTYVLVTNQLN